MAPPMLVDGVSFKRPCTLEYLTSARAAAAAFSFASSIVATALAFSFKALTCSCFRSNTPLGARVPATGSSMITHHARDLGGDMATYLNHLSHLYALPMLSFVRAIADTRVAIVLSMAQGESDVARALEYILHNEPAVRKAMCAATRTAREMANKHLILGLVLPSARARRDTHSKLAMTSHSELGVQSTGELKTGVDSGGVHEATNWLTSWSTGLHVHERTDELKTGVDSHVSWGFGKEGKRCTVVACLFFNAELRHADLVHKMLCGGPCPICLNGNISDRCFACGQRTDILKRLEMVTDGPLPRARLQIDIPD